MKNTNLDSNTKLLLDKGWFLKSSKEVKANGKYLSSSKFKPKKWYKTEVPSTVVAALAKNKVYPDPYFGDNLKKIPTEQFKSPWWFCKEFSLPADYANKNIWLHFDGIVYQADIWLNGQLIANRKKAEGVYSLFKFNVTKYALPGKKNYLAVLVYPVKPGDLGLGFCDWAPFPPDNNLGIWQDVYLRSTGQVIIEHPHVLTSLDPSLDKAHLTVSATLTNSGKETVSGTLEGKIENISFSETVTLAGNESKTVTFAPDKVKQLNIANPKLWWPHTIGPQNLYNLDLTFKIKNTVSDTKKLRFGIRTISSYFNKEGYRVFQVNGKNVLIRGGGYSDDLLLQHSYKRTTAILQYVKDMNLNTIRLEGIGNKDKLFDLCDEMGILVMAGWSCCWEWSGFMGGVTQGDFGCIATEHQMNIAAHYWREQVLRLRNRPSIFVWLYGSDKPPRPELEKRYIDILNECDKTRPYLNCAKNLTTELAGNTGVKMRGPYDYVPPFYYYMNTNAGGAYSFGTEQGPGPVIPRFESIKKIIPKDNLWPLNDVWQYHTMLLHRIMNINDLIIHSCCLELQYGRVWDHPNIFCKKSQLMNYDAARSMFEAYTRNKYLSTGFIAWMLNAPWPSIGWQLFDYFLLQGGAYFGTKKGCEPLHVQYSYDDNSIWVVNAYYKEFKGLKVSATVYNMDMTEKYSNSGTVDIGPDNSIKAFDISFPENLDMCFFLKLDLKDTSDKLITSNFYVLSKLSTPGLTDTSLMKAIANGDGPTKPLSDFRKLEELPVVELKNNCKIEEKNGQITANVSLENTTKNIALFVQLTVTKGKNGEPVAPILWDDNYFSLIPSEKKEVKAVFDKEELGKAKPFVKIEGWNISDTQNVNLSHTL